MTKRMRIMLISMGVLFGCIFAFQGFKALMIKRFIAANGSPTVTVSAMPATYSSWQPKLEAVGSLRAIHGVSVTTELAGMVKEINFTPGSFVQQGTVLVQLNADTDNAQLQSLQATADLQQLVYNRDKEQYTARAISKAVLDNDNANLKNALAQVAAQQATVDKKTIKAPFSGQLGISAIDPGEYLNVGDKIVTLQQLDPIYVDFYIPQQYLAIIKIGQSIKMTVDTFPDKTFTGKITTIDPLIDAATRNAEVEATVANPHMTLAPGMFASVNIITGKAQSYLTLPQTAISFNPYGDVAYVIESQPVKNKKDKPVLIAKQRFVTTGLTRGDQVAIVKGLKEGDMVVTSGQLNLKNGSKVIINNTVQPENDPNPTITDE